VEAGEDPSAGIVGGEAVAQVEGAGEPVLAIATALLEGGERVGPGQDAADGDEDEVDQGVLAGALDARVRKIPEVVFGTPRARRWAESGPWESG
jgi:hypothetical protein